MRLGLRAKIVVTVVAVTLAATAAMAFAAYRMESASTEDRFISSARDNLAKRLDDIDRARADSPNSAAETAKLVLTSYTLGRFGVVWILYQGGRPISPSSSAPSS